MEESNATILSATLTGLIFIIFLISLTHAFVAGDFGGNGTQDNRAPVILIPHNVRGAEGQLIKLDASKSFDPDGDPIKFRWKKISPNESVNLLDDTSPIASFVLPQVKSEGTILFELSIFDGKGNTDTARFPVIVIKKTESVNRKGPSVVGGSNHLEKRDQVDKFKTKSLLLSSGDPKPKLKARSDSKVPRLNEQASNFPVVDNKIKVNAGHDMEVQGGYLVNLKGKIVSNPISNQIKLSWTQKKGPHIELSSNDILDPFFIAPQFGKNERIQFELDALDQNGLVDSDYMNVIVLANSSKQLDAGDLSAKQFGSTATTSDTKPPTVVSTVPTNGAKGILITSKIKATFSEPMLASSITTSTFTLKVSGSSTYVTGTRSLSSSDGYKTAILAPSSNLKPSTTYVATLTRGVRDQAGNAMTIVKTWWFTTGTALSNSYDNFEAGTYTMSDNQKSPNGKWTTEYTGFGQVGVKEESGGNNVFYEFPKTSTQSGETHSSLVLSTQKFSNSIIELDVRTDKQLRQNSPPNTWEAAWIMWRFADDFHHYYFVLKTNGFEFGKKDNNCNCEQQIFLKTGSSPKLVLNQWAHIKISSIGKHTTIWVNTGGGDAKVIDMDDPSYNSAQMSGGGIGLYNEDASVAFDNVKITPQ